MLEKSGDGLDDCSVGFGLAEVVDCLRDGPCWILLILFLGIPGILGEVQQVKYPEESQRPEKLGLAFPDLACLL